MQKEARIRRRLNGKGGMGEADLIHPRKKISAQKEAADYILETVGKNPGQVILYRKNYTYDNMPHFDTYNVEVVTGMKWNEFASRYKAAI